MRKLIRTLITFGFAVVVASTTTNAFANPFKGSSLPSETDYSQTSMPYIYDGDFENIPNPHGGQQYRILLLQSVIFDFIDGVQSVGGSHGSCYPTGKVSIPWNRETKTTDGFGNTKTKNEKFTAYVPPELEQMFLKINLDSTYNSSGYLASRDIIRKYGCNSSVYKKLFSQIIALKNYLESQILDVTEEQYIEAIKKCSIVYPWQYCSCSMKLKQKYYTNLDDYLKHSSLPAALREQYIAENAVVCPESTWKSGDYTSYPKVVQDFIAKWSK